MLVFEIDSRSFPGEFAGNDHPIVMIILPAPFFLLFFPPLIVDGTG